MMKMTKATVIALVGAAAIGTFLILEATRQGPSAADDLVAVTVPDLSAQAAHGEKLFAENCAACHGENGGGTDQGPPLIHRIYEPNHHGDRAFLIAATQGARAHHWRFGDMPPVEGVTPRQVADIVAYVREVQRANGID